MYSMDRTNSLSADGASEGGIYEPDGVMPETVRERDNLYAPTKWKKPGEVQYVIDENNL